MRRPQAGRRRTAPAARRRAGVRPTGSTARAPSARAYRESARRQLRRYRQGSVLAIALTAILLMLWGGAPLELDGEETGAGAATAGATQPPQDTSEAVEEAAGTIRELVDNFYAFLPRLLLVLVLLGAAVLISKLARALLDRTLGAWERAAAVTAVVRLVVFLVAAVAALSILAGDVRAVVGSVGLLGLAASWALQTPIESFTGWLLNAFRGYYRVGDRIAVGDVFGDVYRIDVLTTTVWEAGGAGKPVAAAQSTGALITFPNWEVLRSNVVNYSRDFPYVWDELTVNVASESDLGYCAEVMEETARRVLGAEMEEGTRRYDELLRSARLTFDVDEIPRVYLSAADSWTDCTVRYLVPVRSRRKWSSALLLEIARELASHRHRGRIFSVYPRREVVVREGWTPQAAPPGPDGE